MPSPSSERVRRKKLERDLLLVPHAGTDRSEATEDGGPVTKAGFDTAAREAAKRWFLENLPAQKRSRLQ